MSTGVDARRLLRGSARGRGTRDAEAHAGSRRRDRARRGVRHLRHRPAHLRRRLLPLVPPDRRPRARRRRVAAVGEAVDDGVRVGDRVAVDPSLFCGWCFFCQRNQGNHCLQLERDRRDTRRRLRRLRRRAEGEHLRDRRHVLRAGGVHRAALVCRVRPAAAARSRSPRRR